MARDIFWHRNDNQNSAVIFIHGFGGDIQKTWGRFPDFLIDNADLDGWDVWSVGYPSNLLLPELRGIWKATPNIQGLAETLATRIRYSFKNYRNIALVAHSMGGLVVQRALCDRPEERDRVSHVFLFGTPSNGLIKAKIGKKIIGKRQIEDMAEGGTFISRLRIDWEKEFGHDGFPFHFCAIAGNTDEFVPVTTSHAPFLRKYQHTIPGDHLQIVKPEDPDEDSVIIVREGLLTSRPGNGSNGEEGSGNSTPARTDGKQNASVGRDANQSVISTGPNTSIEVHYHSETPSQPSANEPEPAKPTPPRIQTDSLPTTDPHLFGREEELAALNSAWKSQKTNVVTVVAWGGVGKSALMNRWVDLLCGAEDCRGATRVFGWSFYSQGAGEGKQASADRFVDAALRWFGDPEPEAGSPAEKGRRLAAMVQAERTLLILDGLEPVQHPPGPQEGKLKDEALRALLRNLAVRNPGMCLITTRLAVDDLRTHENSTVSKMELRHLSPGAGAAVLGRLGVIGPKPELETASTEFDGHALALNLLGTYLESLFDGDVRQRDKIPMLADEEVGQGGHARRVMEAYETWLAETEKGRRALSILRIMGLFDRPAEKGAIDAVTAGEAISGLTDALKGLDEKGWKLAVKELRKLRLLAEKDEDRPDALDCHPLVREHFGERLKAEFPEGWKGAHGRLYEYYKAKPDKELPDTLEEMEPLFAAVAHGCLAGRQQEALDEVYWERISRKQDAYSVKKLGAFGADLAAVSQFFETAWTTPAAGLTDQFKAGVLSWAGFRLRAMGRLREAVEPIKAGMEMSAEQEDWKGAAQDASNLSELHLTLGDVAEAVAYGQRSVEFADRSGDGFWKMVARTTHADALHQSGDLDAAEALFQEAEALQAEDEPQYPRLYSLPGYRYCDLLLSRGRHGEVVERATQTLGWVRGKLGLLDEALDHLSLGRAHLLQALADGTNDFAPAKTHLNAAVEGLRQAGEQEFIARALLARAALFRQTNQFQPARDDLTEAHEIAQFGEMRLHLADYHLEAARLCLAQNQRDKAADHLSHAEKLIEETGYHRRDGEVGVLRGELENGPPLL